MIKLIWRFALLVIAAIFFTWLADRPGTVTIEWLGREIQTSFIVAVGIALLAAALLWFIWNLFRRLVYSPVAVRDYWRFRKNRKGYESLSRGIIAAGAGDAVAAAKHASIAGNALADEPLVNVLAAQAAQLKGDHASVKRIFEAMTKSSETEALGLRGLFAEARQNGDVTAAMIHATRALKLNPRLAWASSAVLQLQSIRKDWAGAVLTLQQQAKSGLAATAESNQKQAALLAAQALSVEDKEPATALTLSLKAHKLDPGLVPAALVAARVHASQGSPRKATKITRATWEITPHPDLAEVLAHAKPGDGPEPRFERVRDLVGHSPDNLEGIYALARAAVAAQRWDVARKAMEPLLADQPQARICALMADVEEGGGDKGRAREWLSRALNAPRDPMWVSDGIASPRWVPISPVSGEVVPCQWKAPFEVLPLQTAQQISSPEPVIETPAKVEKPPVIELTHLPDDPGLDPDLEGSELSAGASIKPI